MATPPSMTTAMTHVLRHHFGPAYHCQSRNHCASLTCWPPLPSSPAHQHSNTDNWGSTEGGGSRRRSISSHQYVLFLFFLTVLIFLNNYRYHDKPEDDKDNMAANTSTMPHYNHGHTTIFDASRPLPSPAHQCSNTDNWGSTEGGARELRQICSVCSFFLFFLTVLQRMLDAASVVVASTFY